MNPRTNYIPSFSSFSQLDDYSYVNYIQNGCVNILDKQNQCLSKANKISLLNQEQFEKNHQQNRNIFQNNLFNPSITLFQFKQMKQSQQQNQQFHFQINQCHSKSLQKNLMNHQETQDNNNKKQQQDSIVCHNIYNQQIVQNYNQIPQMKIKEQQNAKLQLETQKGSMNSYAYLYKVKTRKKRLNYIQKQLNCVNTQLNDIFKYFIDHLDSTYKIQG